MFLNDIEQFERKSIRFVSQKEATNFKFIIARSWLQKIIRRSLTFFIDIRSAIKTMIPSKVKCKVKTALRICDIKLKMRFVLSLECKHLIWKWMLLYVISWSIILHMRKSNGNNSLCGQSPIQWTPLYSFICLFQYLGPSWVLFSLIL